MNIFVFPERLLTPHVKSGDLHPNWSLIGDNSFGAEGKIKTANNGEFDIVLFVESKHNLLFIEVLKEHAIENGISMIGILSHRRNLHQTAVIVGQTVLHEFHSSQWMNTNSKWMIVDIISHLVRLRTKKILQTKPRC